VFIPMHYDVTNQLTRAEFDPHSRQPSYKYCAVRVEKIGSAAVTQWVRRRQPTNPTRPKASHQVGSHRPPAVGVSNRFGSSERRG
jgi:hypothetical protein